MNLGGCKKEATEVFTETSFVPTHFKEQLHPFMDLQREQTLDCFTQMSSWKICLGQEQTIFPKGLVYVCQIIYIQLPLCLHCSSLNLSLFLLLFGQQPRMGRWPLLSPSLSKYIPPHSRIKSHPLGSYSQLTKHYRSIWNVHTVNFDLTSWK